MMNKMGDMFKMLKDASAMQKQVKKIQGQLREKTVEFASGKVTVTARGDASIARIKIDPAVIDPAKASALEKMVLEAVEGALESAKKMSADEMQKMMADMGMPNIPGM